MFTKSNVRFGTLIGGCASTHLLEKFQSSFHPNCSIAGPSEQLEDELRHWRIDTVAEVDLPEQVD
jgi:hypothetical protein